MTNQEIATMLRELNHRLARHQVRADRWNSRAAWFMEHGLQPLASVCVYLAKAYMAARNKTANTLERS